MPSPGACHQTVRSPYTLNHLRQTFLHEIPHEHNATRTPKTMTLMFGRVAERSERRYNKIVGEVDQLDNFNYINKIGSRRDLRPDVISNRFLNF